MLQKANAQELNGTEIKMKGLLITQQLRGGDFFLTSAWTNQILTKFSVIA